MAEFPALPFFTDAYLADTRHLTTEEHGAYLLLLMCAWRTRGCALKDSDPALARIVGVTRPRWRKLRPVVAEFFTIEDGLWRQKKLDEVYRGVEARVAKNRKNGAKGGRAKAASSAGSVAKVVDEVGVGNRSGSGVSGGGGQSLPTKARLQKPKPKAVAAAPQEDQPEVAPVTDLTGAVAQVAAAAGLRETKDFLPLLAEWWAAGATLEADILPTITRLRAREVTRGTIPKVLAYYSAAVLEARDARLGATVSGQAYGNANPPAPAKRVFNHASADDWRQFLGDASSRFRGDYLSQNWAISRDHPVFFPADLGSDPRHSVNAGIPAEIHAAYGLLWRWRKT